MSTAIFRRRHQDQIIEGPDSTNPMAFPFTTMPTRLSAASAWKTTCGSLLALAFVCWEGWRPVVGEPNIRNGPLVSNRIRWERAKLEADVAFEMFLGAWVLRIIASTTLTYARKASRVFAKTRKNLEEIVGDLFRG